MAQRLLMFGMSQIFCAAPRFALALWCFCMSGQVSAMPLEDGAHLQKTAPIAASLPETRDFAAGDAPEAEQTPPRRRAVLLPELGDITLPADDAMISPTDRRRHAKKPKTIPFTHLENELDELALDNRGAKAWFADDEVLIDRMQGVRDQVSELLDWGLDEKINAAGRELLETLGIDDTTTTRLMVAERTAEDRPPPWAAQAAGHGSKAGTHPWAAESGRNAFAKFAFLVWDTLTHPAFVALVLLFLGFRLMVALVRLSGRSRARKRRKSRRSAEPIQEKSRSHAKHWTRRRRIR